LLEGPQRLNFKGMLETTRPNTAEGPAGRHMGDLSRGGTNWRVFLETRPHGELVSGRIHFASDQGPKSTTWIFLEWSEQDAIHRFNEFSPIELWKILESLG
jgi:hypothetical protein